MTVKRVAFTLRGSAAWTGGYNYLINLFRALEHSHSGSIIPVLFCGDDALKEDVSVFYSIKNVEIVCSSVFNSQRLTARMARAIITGRDFEALRLFQKENIDVVFENAVFFGWRFPILPGMTAESNIVTGDKTLLAYLLKPIHTSMQQAFHER